MRAAAGGVDLALVRVTRRRMTTGTRAVGGVMILVAGGARALHGGSTGGLAVGARRRRVRRLVLDEHLAVERVVEIGIVHDQVQRGVPGVAHAAE